LEQGERKLSKSNARIFKICVQIISFDEPKGDEKEGNVEPEECVTPQVES